MIKSTILEYFEEPLYSVVDWYTKKVLHFMLPSEVPEELRFIADLNNQSTIFMLNNIEQE
jgi:hypothetical protein